MYIAFQTLWKNVDVRAYIHRCNFKRIHNNNLDVKENVLVY